MTQRVILVPVDNRPVTYVFPQHIGAVAGVETLMPPRSAMGSLQGASNVDALWDWLLHTAQRVQPEAIIVSLDTLLYGGLIPSRRTEENINQVMARTKPISKWKNLRAKQPRVYAQSSIMRISDNYDNTEEKEYWAKHGREIFSWSEALHRLRKGSATRGEIEQLEAKIDADIRKDYLDTRQRNYQVNRNLIDFVKSGAIDYLVFSQDDSGEYGLNVLEKERLLDECSQKKVSNVAAYAGADEVLMTLLARWLVNNAGERPSIKLVFSSPGGSTIPSRYEGQTIGQSLNSQIQAADLRLLPTDTNQDIDFTVLVHTGDDRQGDHIWLPGHPDLRSVNSKQAVAATIRSLEALNTPVVLCDVAYANGADPLLVDEMLKRKDLLKKLWGYGGWNTTGNAVGSALALGTAAWFAHKNTVLPQTKNSLKAALFVRFADDWAYQTQVRRILNEAPQANLNDLMAPHLARISDGLDYTPNQVDLSLPWNRHFEVEVALPGVGQPLSV